MTQSEFIKQFQANLEAKGWGDLKLSEVKEILETVGETILQMLKQKPPAGKNAVAVVRGVGRFTKIDKPARWGFKPFTDPPEKMKFAAKKTIRVTPDKDIRNALNPPKAAAKKAPAKKAPAKKR